MKLFPEFLIPRTLRARYILIALVLFVLLVFIAIFGWYSVQQGVHKHHSSMEVIADLEDVVHEFSLQYQGVKYATLEFLVQPDEQYHKNYLNSIEAFKQSFNALKTTQRLRTGVDFNEHYERLKVDVQQLETELEKIVAVRLDAEKTFPFSTIMLSIADDNIQILSILDRVILLTEADSDKTSDSIRQLFTDTRYTWVRLMAEFRLLVSVRFGIFTGDWQTAYKNRVYNISLYIKKLDEHLLQLRKLQADGQLSFENDSDVDQLYSLVNDASYYFQHAVMQLGSVEWRQDLVLLRENIRPAFARLDKAIHLLHIKEEQVQLASMNQLTVLAKQLSGSLWILLVVGSAVILLGYFMFSRAIVSPISKVAQALKDEAGGEAVSLESYSSASEITDLTDAFHEMRKQVSSRQKRLVNILDNAAEAIITIDDRGMIETFNAAAEKLFGYRCAEVLGKSTLLLMPEADRENYQRFFLSYQRHSHGTDVSASDDAHEVDVLNKQQQLIPVSVKISKTKIDGHVLYTALVVDISERLASEQERQQHLDEMAHAGRLSIMGEMAAGIAHELNQPLAAMSLYLQASLRRCDPALDTCRDITRAVNSSIAQVERASGIIKNMRSFAHRETFHLEVADLNELIHRSVDLVLMSQQDISPQLELMLAPSPLTVSVDVLQIEQVLVNLIRNAFDAQQDIAESERLLQIISEVDNKGFVSVFVVDAGEGVTKDNADKIFDTYFTTKQDGLGMGLSICRSIIEQHDGVLWHRNRPGGGSKFCFILPLQTAGNSNEENQGTSA